MAKEKEILTPEELKQKSIQLALDVIKKAHGADAIFSNNSEVLDVEVFSSGALGIDRALGGGWARGRMVEVMGPESCIAGGSFIPYEVWNGETRSNHKGGTIARLYERFTGDITDDTSKQGRHNQNNACDFYVKSVDHEGKIVRNKVLDVVKTGYKTCLKLELETGEVLFSTPEHKYMTPNGFIPLSDLSFGDTVFVHNNTRVKGRKEYLNRPEVCVKYHPHLPTKKVKCNKTGNVYIYYRAQKSRLAFEAYMNNYSYDAYIRYLNIETVAYINNLQFLSPEMHIHHRDENFNNNHISNLVPVDPSTHGALHAKDRLKNLSFVVVPSKIINITTVGKHNTYDIKCAHPYNNYIAEGIVVHNSGKTTLTLHAIASIQKAGGIAAFVDAEHALDPVYAANLGVNMDDLLISQPDCGETALNIVDTLVRTNAVDLIIVDSVAALVPRAEIEGDMGDSHMGLQARLMSQAMRKLAGICHKSNCTIMFINQIRMKIGIVYGNPEVGSGGNALKFYSSQRVDIRRVGGIKGSDENDSSVKFTGNHSRIKVTKNKIAPPFKEVEFDIIYGKGIDVTGDIIGLAVDQNIVDKAGSWYSYGETRLGQGQANAARYLEENTELLAEIRGLIV